MDKRYIVTLTDQERRSLRALLSCGKGAVRKLVHARILLQVYSAEGGVGDLAVGAYGDDDGGRDRGAVWILFLDGVGGDACQYKLKRDSKPKGGCRACPVKGDIIASKENCEKKKDCDKKLKGKIPSPTASADRARRSKASAPAAVDLPQTVVRAVRHRATLAQVDCLPSSARLS